MEVVNGWTLFAHPLFLDQVEELIQAVERERKKDPASYQSGANAKLLAAIHLLVWETIPSDPTRDHYRQGNTLGPEYKHWLRAKFGGQRFRLFFRYDSRARIVVYASVNDDETKRTYGSKKDAFAVFRKMLERGNPPDDWNALLKASSTAEARTRFLSARLRKK